MTYGYDGVLKVESDGGVRVITLNDPDKLNAMTDPLHEALTDVWVHIMRDPDARAVVLTGAGRAFSAGGNIPGFLRNVEDVEYRRAGMRTARLLVDHILGCHLPVIAAVNGPAVGLGCSLAVSADIVLMADNAYLADTHVSIGLVAGDGGVVTWPFMISLLKAKEYLFTGDRIPAQTAGEIGLANRVVTADSVLVPMRNPVSILKPVSPPMRKQLGAGDSRINAAHSAWVTSYFPIQNPLLRYFPR